MIRVLVNFNGVGEETFDELITKAIICGAVPADVSNRNGIVIECKEENDIPFVNFLAECIFNGCEVKGLK